MKGNRVCVQISDFSFHIQGYATAQAGPVIDPSLSVNSFLPEAVIISRSFARVMPT